MYDGQNVYIHRLKLVTVVEMTEYPTEYETVMPGSSTSSALARIV